MEARYLALLLLSFCILFVVFFVWRLPQKSKADDKGGLGEREVGRMLERGLDESYCCLNDLIVPFQNGATTQIDHVCLSVYGIFVIETKNFSGWVYGGEHDAQWTQVLFQNRYRFQNPLRQNYAHIRALSALLRLPEGKFHSVVVFLEGCELKTELPANVCHAGRAAGYIKGFRKPLLDKGQVEAAAAVLGQKKFRATAKKRRNHVKQLQKRLGKRP